MTTTRDELRDQMAESLRYWGDYGYEGWVSHLEQATAESVAEHLASVVDAYVAEKLAEQSSASEPKRLKLSFRVDAPPGATLQVSILEDGVSYGFVEPEPEPFFLDYLESE